MENSASNGFSGVGDLEQEDGNNIHKGSFQGWFSRNRTVLIHYVFGQLSGVHHNEAEDVLQMVMAEAWRRIESNGSIFVAEIYRLLRLRSIDIARKYHRRMARDSFSHEGEDHETSESPDVILTKKEVAEKALACIQNEEFRQAFVLYIQGFTYEEIAKELGINQNTAASRVRYAIHDIRSRRYLFS